MTENVLIPIYNNTSLLIGNGNDVNNQPKLKPKVMNTFHFKDHHVKANKNNFRFHMTKEIILLLNTACFIQFKWVFTQLLLQGIKTHLI